MEASNPYAAPTAEVRDMVQEGEKQPLAGLGARLGASILDGLIFFLVVYLPMLLLTGMDNLLVGTEVNYMGILAGPGGIAGGIGLLALIAITIYLVHKNGQTIGKKMVGIKVVRTDGSRASLGRIFWLRNVPLWLVSIIPLVGGIISLVDTLLIFRSSRQCLHDQIAGTIVVEA